MNEQEIIAEKDRMIAKLLRDKAQIEQENKIAKQEKQLVEKEIEIVEYEKKIVEQEKAKLEGQLYDISFELEQLKKKMFGSRSERKSPSELPNQLSIDFDGLTIKETPEEKKQTVTYQRKKRQEKIKPSRQVIPEHLPRIDHIIVPEGDLSEMTKIGEEVTEELEYEPAKLFVNRFIREKYIDQSKSTHLKSEVLIADLPSRPIHKGIPGPRLLAQLVVSKYVDHLPIYRQRQMFKRLGIDLSESTVYGWMSAVSKLLEPLYDELKKLILDLDYLMVDETPISVLDPVKRKTTHKGWYWLYYSPLTRQVLFDYRKGRGREGPSELLENYKGFIQTDGYAAYDVFDKDKPIILLGCMAHARRKFIEAEKQDPARANYVLSEMQKLYALEKTMREEQWTAKRIVKKRKQKALPILFSLQEWMQTEYNKVTPKSAIGKAIAYSLNRWQKLMGYTLDGKLQIDNNLVENQVRPIALGRKNYLFAGSHSSAKDSAIFYSLLGSCRHNNIDPMEYFTTVLSKINDTKTNELIKLLPGSKSM